LCCVTDSIEHSPWEADSHSASQEIPSLLRNSKFHYCAHKSRHWSLFWARWVQSTP